MNQLTIKSQEAIQQASQLAVEHDHQAIETAHLLAGILAVDDHVTPFLLKKLGVSPEALLKQLEDHLTSLAKVEGGTPYLTREANTALQRANAEMKKMGDEYVSIEHLLLSILKTKDQSSQTLKDLGVNETDLRKAIDDLRKGSKVTSHSAEESYNALGKYAIHLNERAR
ncbi:MAG: type VI secretion system ATPase TssH, partial [Saprospiraceae bacterium]|nr:type VI secretion system ATPase TssH [Saprospiraceae bacterium]